VFKIRPTNYISSAVSNVLLREDLSAGSLVEFDQHATVLHVDHRTAGAVENVPGSVEAVSAAPP